ncbi:MAG: hypothetical protein H8M99_06535 [Gloeobacteraceae cyanobacterium ES-bin-144]|nr:hypothetical protein [Verrucomicrobiales bacterium]
MRLFTALVIYRLLLPLLFIAAFPGWIVKMLRRGGLGTRLGERVAVYTTEPEYESCGATHLHAISVGEALLALKLIREWLVREPDRCFVIATGTATGHAVATAAAIQQVRVTYAPLDFPSMVRRYLGRFEPAEIVFIEGDIWPHLLVECRKRNIPTALVNARMSPRSARRFSRFAKWIRPIFSLLDAVAIQQAEDALLWQNLGARPQHIHDTGSLKFDSLAGEATAIDSHFQQMLDVFGKNRPVILAASTHAGEDAWIASAIHAALPEALIVIVPRHAERRAEVSNDLSRVGFPVILRSQFQLVNEAHPNIQPHTVFVIDSTGELRAWTTLADVVIIGKSFLSTGGQNPTEAIMAGKPVIFGQHMENFEPLATHLTAAEACLVASGQASLSKSILVALDPQIAQRMTANAKRIIDHHRGATSRIIDLLSSLQALQK